MGLFPSKVQKLDAAKANTVGQLVNEILESFGKEYAKFYAHCLTNTFDVNKQVSACVYVHLSIYLPTYLSIYLSSLISPSSSSSSSSSSSQNLLKKKQIQRRLNESPPPHCVVKKGSLSKRGLINSAPKSRHFVALNEKDNYRVDYFDGEAGMRRGSIDCCGYYLKLFDKKESELFGPNGFKLVPFDITRRFVLYFILAVRTLTN